MGIWLSPFEHLARINAGLYLESGFYDLRSSGKCTADAYKPALLQYDSEVASYVTGTNTPLQGQVTLIRKFWETDTPYNVGDRVTPYSELDLTEIWECTVAGTSGSTNPPWDSNTPGNITLDGPNVQWQYDPGFDGTLVEEPFDGTALTAGMQSVSVGCANLLSEVMDPCGTNWVSQTGPAYCSPAIFTKKGAQFDIPSSTYSGKLALYVQALYGSPRSDYKSAGLSLKVGGTEDNYPEKTIQQGFKEGGWIYTTDDYNYFYCVFSGVTVTFYPMDVSDEARRFKDTLDLHTRTDFPFVKKVEAYVLSTARIHKDPAYVITVAGPVVQGSPLDYGWHTNWKGNEASVVTFFKDPAQDQYLSTQHQLTIGESWNGTNYVFTITNTPLVTDSPWWPWTNGLHLFYYDHTEQSMIPVPYPAIIFGGFEGVFDAPIYNFYKLDDITGVTTLVTCDIFMDIDSKPDINFVLPGGTNLSSPQNYVTDEVIKYIGSSGDKGFRVGGAVTSILAQDLSEGTKAEHIALGQPQGRGWPFDRNGPTASALYPSGVDWGLASGLTIGQTKDIYDAEFDTTFAATWSWRTRWVFMGLETTTNVGNHGAAGSVVFELPKGDCGNIISGENIVKYSDSSSTFVRVETQSAFNGAYIPFGGELVWEAPSNIWGFKVLEIIAGAPPDEVFATSPLLSFVSATTVTNITTPPFSDQANHTWNVHPEGLKLETASAGSAGNAEYFAPTISDKPTHTVDTGRRSIGNKYKVNHDAFDKDGGFLNDSSVGWA